MVLFGSFDPGNKNSRPIIREKGSNNTLKICHEWRLKRKKEGLDGYHQRPVVKPRKKGRFTKKNRKKGEEENMAASFVTKKE